MSETIGGCLLQLAFRSCYSKPGPTRPAERELHNPMSKPLKLKLQIGSRFPFVCALGHAAVGAPKVVLADSKSETMFFFCGLVSDCTFPSLGQPGLSKGGSRIPCRNHWSLYYSLV